MSHNTFGHLFRVTTWGESHGPAIGCVVDGCPPRHRAHRGRHPAYLDKRRPGQSRFTTQRREPDTVKILSGVFADEAQRRAAHHRHADLADDRQRRSALQGLCRDQGLYRPGHADYTYDGKVRHARLSRRRPRIGARDRDARRGRRHRAARSCRASPSAARWCRSARTGSTAPTGTGTRSTAIRSSGPTPTSRRALGRLPRRRAQGRLVGRRDHRGRRRRRARGAGRADLRQARRRSRRGADGDQRGQGRRDRRRLRRGGAFRRRERRRDAHGQRRQAGLPLQPRRRHPRRHFHRPAGRRALCRQADVVDPHAAPHRRPSGDEIEISTKGRHDPCVGIRAVPIGEAMLACVLADHYLRHRGQVGDSRRGRRRRADCAVARASGAKWTRRINGSRLPSPPLRAAKSSSSPTTTIARTRAT